MADPTIPSFSEQLWSEQVGLAGGTNEEGPGYVFSSGRTYVKTPYDPPVPIPQPEEPTP
jgi:hypothetical protein